MPIVIHEDPASYIAEFKSLNERMDWILKDMTRLRNWIINEMEDETFYGFPEFYRFPDFYERMARDFKQMQSVINAYIEELRRLL